MGNAQQDEVENLEKYTFTMIPNVFFKEVFPNLDTTEQSVIIHTLRMTIGFHVTTAEISNAEFAAFSHVSVNTIIAAKKRLIKMRLLVQVSKGGGLKKAVYGISLSGYRRWRAGLDSKKVIDVPEDTTTGEGPPYEVSVDANYVEALPTYPSLASGEASARDGKSKLTYNSSAVEPEPPLSSQDTANPTKSSSAKSEAPLIEDLEKGPGVRSKTNKGADEKKLAEPSSESDVEAVCFSLRFFGFEPKRRDIAFIRVCLSEYGLDAIQDKLRIAKLQTGRGKSIANVMAWLRCALRGNWRPSKKDMTAEKAREAAERAYQRGLEEQREWSDYREKVKTESDDEGARGRIEACIQAFYETLEDESDGETQGNSRASALLRAG